MDGALFEMNISVYNPLKIAISDNSQYLNDIN